MLTLIDSLKTRYDAVFQSDTDSRFYQNLHHYFDLVEKTPELHALMLESQKEYAEKHGNINREKALTEEEADVKEELTLRVERFNLYAAGCTIYVRVYLPIEDYKNSLEPEDKQDPVALLMMVGIKNIKTKRWSQKHLSVYNRWFDGMRPLYEKELRQFNLLLVDAIEKVQKATPAPVVQKPIEKKPPIEFIYRTGDFAYQGASGNLTPNSQEYKVFKALLDSENYLATYSDLIRTMRPSAEDSKSQRADLAKTILRLKEKMGIPERCPDIFQNVKGTGYRLVFPDSNQKAE